MNTNNAERYLSQATSHINSAIVEIACLQNRVNWLQRTTKEFDQIAQELKQEKEKSASAFLRAVKSEKENEELRAALAKVQQ